MIKQILDKQIEEPVFVAADSCLPEIEKAKVNLDNFSKYLEKNPTHPLDAFLEVSQSINHAFGYLCNQLNNTEASIKNSTIASNEFKEKLNEETNKLSDLKARHDRSEGLIKESIMKVEALEKELDTLCGSYTKKKKVAKALSPILLENEDILSKFNYVLIEKKRIDEELDLSLKDNKDLQAKLESIKSDFSSLKNDQESEIKNIISEIKYLDKKTTEITIDDFSKQERKQKNIRRSVPAASTFVINDTFKCSQSELSFLTNMIESINTDNQKIMFDINSKITDIQLIREENENLRLIIREISES